MTRVRGGAGASVGVEIGEVCSHHTPNPFDVRNGVRYVNRITYAIPNVNARECSPAPIRDVADVKRVLLPPARRAPDARTLCYLHNVRRAYVMLFT